MKKLPTEWNLKLLYKSPKDPQIEIDIRNYEVACEKFVKTYREKDFLSRPEYIVRALADYENLYSVLENAKAWWYGALCVDTNIETKKAESLKITSDERIRKAQNTIRFFLLELGKIAEDEQKKILAYPESAPYKYFLTQLWKMAQHRLSEKEENLISLLSNPARENWIDGQSKVLSQKTLVYKKKEITLAEAQAILPYQNEKGRQILQGKINDIYIECSSFAESEINSIFSLKKVLDDLKGFNKPYSGTVMNYENDEETVENLVQVVTKGFSLSKRFYTLQAKILGKNILGYEDRSVPVGTIKRTFDYITSCSILRDAFGNIDSTYADILESFVQNGQIDVYPRKGKKGGAYCWGRGTLPTFVKLNHADDINSFETFGHEMGHAIHTELSKNNRTLYRDYSTSTAEVASTFFEQIALDAVESLLSDKEKIVLLHQKIRGDVSTIFRQIAVFNFENELHLAVRKQGYVQKEEIAQMMNRHMSAYLGKSIKMKSDDGYCFVGWPHIRNHFYVYSYAFGQLISKALYAKFKEDKSFNEKIKQFLSAGGSMSPEDIFANIGIDVRNPDFFALGLKEIENDIARLEKMVAKSKR